jgi:hemerythrin superfamily protein
MPAQKTASKKRSTPAKKAPAKKASKRSSATGRSAIDQTKASVKKATTSARKAVEPMTKAATAATRAVRGNSSTSRSSGGSRQGRSALDVLRQDHREVEELFSRFEKTSASGQKRREQLVDKMIEALSIHAAIEEEVFYPAIRREVAGANDHVLESLEEHHVVKLTLRELQMMNPSDERYAAKVAVLTESVRHHVKEEEQELFPMVRKALGTTRLRDLGIALVAAKGTAPDRPHPEAPDTPPGNIVAKAVTAPFDVAANITEATARRVRDLVT